MILKTVGETTKLVLYVAKKGASYHRKTFSTIKIAADLSTSQQTVSRWLIALEKKGLIERQSSTRGIVIKLTKKARAELKELHIRLGEVFANELTFQGAVRTGLGEGAYYMGLPTYQEQFRKKLNMKPYPGTLNLKIDPAEFQQFIEEKRLIPIEGFKTKERSFGGIDAYRVTVNGADSALIIPKRTSHDSTMVEIISETYFRSAFKLKDGDRVTIT